MNLGHLVRQAAVRHGERAAVVCGDVMLTWSEVDRRTDALAVALRRLGVGKGDRVLVQARNSHRAFETKWACFKAGAVWVPCNFRLTPPEVAYLAVHSGVRVMLHDAEFAENAKAVRVQVPEAAAFVCFDAERPGSESYDVLLARYEGEAFLEADVEHGDPAWFFYTSGTTGRPKAAVLTHGQLAFVVASHLADMFPGTTAEDTSLVLAPLSHGAGVHALAHIARATTQVIYSDREMRPRTVWEMVERYRVTNLFVVPTLLKSLVDDPAVDEFDHTSLRYVNYGGAPMYRADQQLALQKLGPVLVQHYGLGEFTANITVLPPHLHGREAEAGGSAIGTCGFARTGIEIAILGEDGFRLPTGADGEICARGPASFVGYHDNPEATAAALRDGWFHTGDIGHLDERGLLFLTGRQSDMYISGGLNVYPREAEEVLISYPAIVEAAVVGVPDQRWGEVGCAVIVTRSGRAIDAGDLERLFDGRIARFKVPRRYEFWPALPKSAYGKVLKREIVARLAARDQGPAHGAIDVQVPA